MMYYGKKRTSSYYARRDTYNSGIKNGWSDIRKKVLARDNNRCVYCGREASEVHHLIPLGMGGTTTMSNLVSVCRECHSKKHRKL